MIVSRRKSVTRFSHAVLDYRDRLLTNGGQVSWDTLLALDVFITTCQDKNLWDSLLEIYPFTGAGLASALVKLKYISTGTGVLTNVGFVEDDYHELGAHGGLQGDGVAKHLHAGITGDAVSSLFFQSRTAVNVLAFMIGETEGGGSVQLGTTGTHDRFYWGTVPADAAQANAPGFFAGAAPTAAKRDLYVNGALAATTSAEPGAVIAGADLYLFARNVNNVGAAFWPGLCGFAAVGNANWTAANMAALAGAVGALQAALQRTGNAVVLGDGGRPLGDGANQLGE